MPDEVLRAGQAHSGINTIKRILIMAVHSRWRMVTGLICTVIAANFQLLIPQYLGEAVDTAQGFLAGGVKAEQARDALMFAAMMLLGAGVIRGIFTMIHNYMGESIGQNIGYQLRLAYFAKLQQLSFSYHDRVHTGDMITRGMLDIEGVRRFIDGAMYRVIVLVILVSVGGYLLISTDVVMGLLSLSFIPIVAWRGTVSRLHLRRTWRFLQERMSILTRTMEENLGGIRVVRAFAGQEYELRKFEVSSQSALSMSKERIQIRTSNAAIMAVSYYLAMVLVLWVGGIKIIDGEFTVGQLAEFLTFMAILQQPVRQISMVVNSTARASISGGRVFEVLDLEPDVSDSPGAPDLVITRGVLRFENVDFSYKTEDGEKQALHGISFDVVPGKSIGIVGPPGSGKSTIAHLIPRFYDVTGGRITIDGQDIRTVTTKSLRAAVGVVQQDTFMFTADIESNVAYGDPVAGHDRITGAAESAQLHDYIMRLPDRYGTMVGERGVMLSGGQRQRLSIARSVLLEPVIMVFDDSTAAIDAATEQRIRAALKDITNERATLIISHRLSSLMHADEILFIDNGRIVERGTHEELVAMGGKYAALYELQINLAA